MKGIGSLALASVLLLAAVPATAQENGLGRVTGRIAWEGVETCRGHAALWDASSGRKPDPRRYVLAPKIARALQPDCTFALEAGAGSYYLGAILRLSAESGLGPPAPGDIIFMSPGPAGTLLSVEVRPGETADVGARRDGWAFAGQSAAGPTVAGRVLHPDGRPAGGLLVFAFDEPQMSGRPIAVSGRTDAEGEFLLRFDRGGKVWLRVMENFGGGRPQDGGYMGVYGGREPAPLEIPAEGSAGEIEIRVVRLPPVNPEMGRRRPPAGD